MYWGPWDELEIDLRARQASLFTVVFLRSWSRRQVQVSFAKEPYERDHILQKRPVIIGSLLIVYWGAWDQLEMDLRARQAFIQSGLSSGLIGLFCKRALWKRLYAAKETYNFKEPSILLKVVCICATVSSSPYVSFLTLLYERHDSSAWETWLVYMSDMTLLYLKHDSSIWET